MFPTASWVGGSLGGATRIFSRPPTSPLLLHPEHPAEPWGHPGSCSRSPGGEGSPVSQGSLCHRAPHPPPSPPPLPSPPPTMTQHNQAGIPHSVALQPGRQGLTDTSIPTTQPPPLPASSPHECPQHTLVAPLPGHRWHHTASMSFNHPQGPTDSCGLAPGPAHARFQLSKRGAGTPTPSGAMRRMRHREAGRRVSMEASSAPAAAQGCGSREPRCRAFTCHDLLSGLSPGPRSGQGPGLGPVGTTAPPCCRRRGG